MAELALECIGDDIYQAFKQAQRFSGGYLAGAWGADKWRPYPHPWVAEVTGERAGYQFLKPRRDYSHANSIGSRGVYDWYHLDEGRLYRIHKLTSWRRSERYYATVINGEIRRLTDEEAEICLSDPLEFQYLRQRVSASHGPSTGPTNST